MIIGEEESYAVRCEFILGSNFVVGKMIRIAVIEDNPNDSELLRGRITAFFHGDCSKFALDQYDRGETFLMYSERIYDIVFFDIELSGMNGLEAAKEFRKVDRLAVIIFITNMFQYAINGYEVEALDFVIKPVSKYDFAMKMERAVSRTAKRTDNAVAVRQSRGQTITLNASLIKYVEVNGHYVVYHTVNGEFREYETLMNVVTKIQKEFFAKCNRCYLINMKYIDAIKKESVIVDGETLTISRPQRKEFLEKYARFLGGAF